MPLIQYAATAPLCQIEGFPAKEGEDGKPPAFKRSADGALHLRPGATVSVTADELDFIRKERKDVARNIRILADDPPEEAAKPAAPPAAPPAPEAPAPPAAAPEAAAPSEAPPEEKPTGGKPTGRKTGGV